MELNIGGEKAACTGVKLEVFYLYLFQNTFCAKVLISVLENGYK